MTTRSSPSEDRPSKRFTGRRRAATRGIAALAVVTTAALGWSAFGNPPVRVVYNASDSMPAGWYRITPAGLIAAGDIVLVALPPEAATLAATRGYLPQDVPLLKSVAGTARQKVCVAGRQVFVDGNPVAKALQRDRLGRRMRPWRGCRKLTGDEILLVGVNRDESFDSRYFGPVPLDSVLGVAHPILTD